MYARAVRGAKTLMVYIGTIALSGSGAAEGAGASRRFEQETVLFGDR